MPAVKEWEAWEAQMPIKLEKKKYRLDVEYVPVNNKLELMLICAMRYAMGRETYVPGETIDYIRPLIPHLSTKTLSVMKRDIEEDIPFHKKFRHGEKIYMEDEWLALGKEIAEEYERRRKNEKGLPG